LFVGQRDLVTTTTIITIAIVTTQNYFKTLKYIKTPLKTKDKSLKP
jgi:hypothetical protein